MDRWLRQPVRSHLRGFQDPEADPEAERRVVQRDGPAQRCGVVERIGSPRQGVVSAVRLVGDQPSPQRSRRGLAYSQGCALFFSPSWPSSRLILPNKYPATAPRIPIEAVSCSSVFAITTRMVVPNTI